MRRKQAQRSAQHRFAAQGPVLLWHLAPGPFTLSGGYDDGRNEHFLSEIRFSAHRAGGESRNSFSRISLVSGPDCTAQKACGAKSID
jgi:hypothetical protein